MVVIGGKIYRGGYKEVHEGFDYGKKNKDAGRILIFVTPSDFIIVTTKKVEYLIINESARSEIIFFSLKG